MKSPGQAWTASEIAQLRAMRECGESFESISQAIGRSSYACQLKATTHQIYKPKAPQREKKHWTKQEERRLHELRAQGMDFAEIGARLNRHPHAVETRARLLSYGLVYAKKSEGLRIPCLNCRKPFPSEGPHNRLCQSCRQLSVSPYEI